MRDCTLHTVRPPAVIASENILCGAVLGTVDGCVGMAYFITHKLIGSNIYNYIHCHKCYDLITPMDYLNVVEL